MSAWGLSDADYASDDVLDIFPDCWESISLFIDLSTQWRVGAAGAVGLDYGVAFQMMRLRRVPRDRQLELLEDLQAMEGEALKTMSEK